MAIYNTSNITNSTDIFQVYYEVNRLSTGLLASAFLYTLFFIIIFMFKNKYDLPTVMLGSSFICAFIGVLFWWLALIGWPVLIPFILIFFGMIIYTKVFG